MSAGADLPKKEGCVCRKQRKPRPYKCDDAPRMVGYAAKNGCSKKGLMVKTAVTLGLGWIFCVAADVVRSFSLISKVLVQIGGALAVTQALEVVVSILTKGKWVKFPILSIALVSLILVLNNLIDIVKALATVFESYGDMTELADLLGGMCEEVKKLGGATAGSVGDLIDLIKSLEL
jgi:hypothetical protein